jgi:pentatricopeptide repeat protein
MIGVVCAKEGRYDEALQIIDDLLSNRKYPRESAIVLAHIHLALGDQSAALNALERSFERHEADLRALTYDPRWNELKDSPRFWSLVASIGLPLPAN